MAGKNSEPAAILIIDDEEQIRNLLKELLGADNRCTAAVSAEDALAVLNTTEFDLVLSDINMGGISGLELVPLVLEKSPDTVVVMISGQQSIDYAIEAMRVGAFDYIMKPLDIRHVQAAVHRALDHQRLLTEKRQHDTHLEDLVRARTAEVQHLAYYDSLTDLPNRVLLADRLDQALAAAGRNHQMLGVLRVSLDRFKKINDTLGHQMGDLLLQEVAARLQACVQLGETIARFGGDEFALLVNGVEKPQDLSEMAQAVSDTLTPSFRLADHEVYLNASIGISVFPADGENSATILKNAGAALYRAKKAGGNNHQFYTTDMNAEAVRRLALENNLRRAIANEEFVTYYQPVVNLASGKVVGHEALVRWQHPEFGLLAPSEFIDLAEDTGLILPMAEQVMSAACNQTRKWQEDGYRNLGIAVNVSARQFQDKNFLDRVVQILTQSRLDPHSLELEITETSIMEHAGSAVEVLSAIQQLGARIAIDDFGTGYSSLSYLKRLPIDTVKLDRSFVNGATTDPNDAALVMAIITLAHNLSLKVVAEGIETEEQRDFLRLLRCDEGQGYLFGKPVPADVLESSMAADPQRKQNIRLLSSNRPPGKVLARKTPRPQRELSRADLVSGSSGVTSK